MKLTRSIKIVFLLLVLSLIFVLFVLPRIRTRPPSLADNSPLLSVANAPFADASMTYLGQTEGVFSKYGLDIRIIDATWADQFDLIASGSADIALASLDQIVARAKNLDTLGKPVVFFLPAWQFIGLGYYTKGNYKSLDYFLKNDSQDAYNNFLSQFLDKKIALTEGTVFEQGFISVVEKSSYTMANFSIINTSPSAGLNGLEDPTVAIASVGYQQWAEAERRGYKRAIAAEDIDVVVITGFMTSAKFAEERRDDIVKFGCAWFEIANIFSSNPKKAYDTIEPKLEARGASPISFEEFQSISLANVIPLSPKASVDHFILSSSSAYWKNAWDQAVKNLKDTGKAAAVPQSATAFQADVFLEHIDQAQCQTSR